jgi:polyisoprenoid-binding protein YceI
MEKISSRTLGLVITLLLLTVPSMAQDLSLHVDFTGSSFDSHSNQLKGYARTNGKKVTADKLVLNFKTLTSGNDLRDKHLWKYLGVDQFPEATLSNVVGEDGKFTGDLTVHGVTRKGIEGEYSIEGGKLKADFKTNISDYKIESPTYMGGTITVEDEVEIKTTIPIAAAAPAAPAQKK